MPHLDCSTAPPHGEARWPRSTLIVSLAATIACFRDRRHERPCASTDGGWRRPGECLGPGPMRSLLVCGARPNYMKIAPIMWAIRALNASGDGRIEPILVHTGQHYDPDLFDVFFRDLDLPAPDYCLDVGSGSHAHQTGEVMKRIEPIME